MTLSGPRHEWQELIRRNDEGWGLKDLHSECIEQAIADAPPDAELVEVDAALPALRQLVERTAYEREHGYMLPLAEIGASTADTDELFWLRRSRDLELTNIRVVEPWPRRPDVMAGGDTATAVQLREQPDRLKDGLLLNGPARDAWWERQVEVGVIPKDWPDRHRQEADDD
jgi:hypothetical protein